MSADQMTVEQARTAKAELENCLLMACAEFEKITGLNIDCINLSKVNLCGIRESNSKVVEIAVVVTLGAA